MQTAMATGDRECIAALIEAIILGLSEEQGFVADQLVKEYGEAGASAVKAQIDSRAVSTGPMLTRWMIEFLNTEAGSHYLHVANKHPEEPPLEVRRKAITDLRAWLTHKNQGRRFDVPFTPGTRIKQHIRLLEQSFSTFLPRRSKGDFREQFSNDQRKALEHLVPFKNAAASSSAFPTVQPASPYRREAKHLCRYGVAVATVLCQGTRAKLCTMMKRGSVALDGDDLTAKSSEERTVLATKPSTASFHGVKRGHQRLTFWVENVQKPLLLDADAAGHRI
ncbi:hypothetical protein B0H13DRAFT_1860296 [Mycena leptocephala]|nr:hypothetical protein B0H13DRAFT_1860296 [Mycena leptocephala]